MLNNVSIQGRLTATPELKSTQSGKAVLSFTLAVDRNRKDTGADFINCVAWDKHAEFVSKYFVKGQMAIVDGRLATRKYEDNNGNTRHVTEVIVDSIYFCEKRSQNAPTEYTEPHAVDFAEVDENDPDLPF